MVMVERSSESKYWKRYFFRIAKLSFIHPVVNGWSGLIGTRGDDLFYVQKVGLLYLVL